MHHPLPKVMVILGTDTEVGKTYFAEKLLQHYTRASFKTLGLKPIASGATRNAEGMLENADALTLQKAASLQPPYRSINPCCFEPAIAPHLAAKQQGITLQAKPLANTILKTIQTLQPDITVLEGAGGFLLPLNATETFPDFLGHLAEHVRLELILVVGMKLGCLNHALLSHQAIQTFLKKYPGTFLGAYPNDLGQPMPYLKENIETLGEWMNLFSPIFES